MCAVTLEPSHGAYATVILHGILNVYVGPQASVVGPQARVVGSQARVVGPQASVVGPPEGPASVV